MNFTKRRKVNFTFCRPFDSGRFTFNLSSNACPVEGTDQFGQVVSIRFYGTEVKDGAISRIDVGEWVDQATEAVEGRMIERARRRGKSPTEGGFVVTQEGRGAGTARNGGITDD